MSNKSRVAVAGKKDTVLLLVADLRMNYDVRTRLNDDRVLFFMERYDSGAEVPPIEVIRGTMDIHDGRHRKAALDHLGRRHAECILVAPMEYLDQMMDAFGKNVSDSPFPPTRADIIFVMKQLLEAGVTNAIIQKRFEIYYKPSHVKKLLKDAHSNVLKAKMSKAKMAVAHGGVSVAVLQTVGVCPDVSSRETRGCALTPEWSNWIKPAEGMAVNGMRPCYSPGDLEWEFEEINFKPPRGVMPPGWREQWRKEQKEQD